MKKEYKIAMLGFGSIAKRHLVNLVEILQAEDSGYSIDLLRRKASKAIEERYLSMINNVYHQFEDMPSDYDIVFITNPTHLHYQSLADFATKAKNFFIEKPVFDDWQVDINRLNLAQNAIYYVACPMRYTKVLQYLKKEIDLTSVYSARAICSSYLPYWRPEQDYRQSYSAHLEQGGGVSIDLIHEWDYLMYLFGQPEEIFNYRGQFSHLEIDSDDLSIYIAKYPQMLVELHLDYFGREPIRELQLFTAEDTIIADFIHNQISFLKQTKTLKFEDARDDYQKAELKNFLAMLRAESNNENDLTTALRSLKIAKEGRL